MTKAELIAEIAVTTGFDKKSISVILDGFTEGVKRNLTKGENVYIRGFGSFVVKHRAEKTARNITKNTTLLIAAHDFPSFKPSKSLVAKMKGEE